MVVVLEAEQIQQAHVRHQRFQLVEYVGTALGERVLNLLHRHLGHVLVAAVCQHFGRILEPGCIQHAFCLFAGEHARFPPYAKGTFHVRLGLGPAAA